MAEVKKALIDVDGCIIDSTHGFWDIFRRQGWVRGDTGVVYSENWGAIMGVDPEEVQRRSDDIWKKGLTLGFQPFPGAREELELLKQHGLGGYTLELYAATSRPETARSATAFSLVTHFPAIFSGIRLTGAYDGPPSTEDHAMTKEHLYRDPDVYLAADNDPKHIGGALRAELPISLHTDIERLYGDQPVPDGVLRIQEWGGAYEKLRDFAKNRE